MPGLNLRGTFEDRPIHVALIGCGGSGSEVFDGLIKIHNGLVALGRERGLQVTAYDPDSVSESNIVRQRFWPSDVGQNKATILIHRANMLFGTDWEAYEEAFDGKRSDFDIIISCVDSLSSRKNIYLANKDKPSECLWMDLGNDDSSGQVVIGHLGTPNEAARIENVVDRYPEILTGKEPPDRDSCSAAESLLKQDLFVNECLASYAMNMFWKLLRTAELNVNGGMIDLFYFDSKPLEQKCATKDAH